MCLVVHFKEGSESAGEIPHFYRFLLTQLGRSGLHGPPSGLQGLLCEVIPSQRQCQLGSLAGEPNLSKDNAGVLRLAQ